MTCYPLPFSITESLKKSFSHTFVVAHAVAFVIFKLRALFTQRIVMGIKKLARTVMKREPPVNVKLVGMEISLNTNCRNVFRAPITCSRLIWVQES